MEVRCFWMPKRGNTIDEYEDAFAADAAIGRFVVADGATESSFAGIWAKLLTEEFVRSAVRFEQRWRDWLPRVQERWAVEVGGRQLPWYAEQKFAQGAFATFLGITIDVPRWRWWAVAVGDSCLFQIRDDELCATFPLDNSTDFDNQPSLLGSRTPAEFALAREKWKTGECEPGNRFLLVTDALAQWLLSQHERAERPWRQLWDQTEESFAAWIESLRNAREIRNDDVTVVAVQLPNAGTKSKSQIELFN
jgi:hypothetical protein